eukprot:CAMPEP_0180621544 /NCGR_PEP_ID=MMETSP1037_2-20121125/35201_1 /TAXON_ID=632150 /ORGANISM="Azadinium spinosum, Strain 3D9" /LENGTH=31 /DNA_ID= /DNA_START= /DNA_END= /DNA_ORIENTATION=
MSAAEISMSSFAAAANSEPWPFSSAYPAPSP